MKCVSFRSKIGILSSSALVVFLIGVAGLRAGAAADTPHLKSTGQPEEIRISSVTPGPVMRYNDRHPRVWMYGDTFYTAWGGDDHLYVVTDDTGGWQKLTPWAGGGPGSNLMIGRLDGSPADPANFRGSDVNLMNGPNEFGAAGAASGSDHRPWKAFGITCVKGALYVAVARAWNFDHGPPPAGTAWCRNMSIIKSSDYGRNWVNHLGQKNTAPPVDDDRCMFPGGRFGTPAFIQYGRDGDAPAIDYARKFIYLYSPDLEQGTGLLLARAPRPVAAGHETGSDQGSDPILDKTRWQFYSGAPAGDGMADANWSIKLSDARPFYNGRLPSHGDMLYDAPLKCYLLITYESYPGRVPATYRLSAARAPWGPWTKVWEHKFDRYYGQPTMPLKYLGADGRTLWLLTSDDFMTAGDPPEKTRYCLHAMKLTLNP